MSMSGKPLVEEASLTAFTKLIRKGHYLLEPYIGRILEYFNLAL